MNYLAVAIFFLASFAKTELKGRYTRDIKDYEIVVPQKVSQTGEFISYYLPHFFNMARVRRGADSGKVHYVVPIEGTLTMLELHPAEDFHGPGLLIEHHDNDARLSIDSVKFRRPQKLNCYYHGRVKGEPSSSAALSACSGLAGEISIRSNHYLIEPVEEGDTPTYGPEHQHLLYKRQHPKGIHNRSSCGTKETFEDAFRERMKWEEKHGREIEMNMMGYNESQTLHINPRSKKWCTTCKPVEYVQCQSPHPPCMVERPLFLELALVIGPRVATDKFIYKDMEQYVNTIINIAAKHFLDSSLERPIVIKLVRVITMGYVYPDLDPHRYSEEDLLKRFCEWQTHFNPPREVHPNHHDFILYLVKFGECHGSMQGLTNVASVCRPDKACGIVNLEGLLTGHVITHMLGHSMGADHDDENASGCLPEEPDGTCYHMAQRICTRSNTWSICSRKCIAKFTSTHAAWCMSDVPTASDLTEPSLLPGQVYSAAEQCRINFELETYACLVGEFCKHLFCKISDSECASTGDPPAQGTRCGPDQWCFNQKCVHRGSRPGAINGEWGIWSQWTPCTKTCGGGVQTANRACDSPPPSNGGRKCPGSWIKSRMCNIKPCADAGKGFLDQQCKNTNTKPYHGRRHDWLYFNQQADELECVVMCINEKKDVAVRAPLALDGTFCKPGSKDVCIRGHCNPVGCDWVIGSKAKEDACGICHGNGTECRLMQGYFTEQNFKGRMPFLKLPIGTSMILMRETRPSPCFFVIANSLNSSYYLNSDEAEDRTFFAGIFTMQFTTGIYQLKANMERIFIKDPIRVPITVSIVCHQTEIAIGILYQYALPETNPDVKPQYTWEFLSWEKCPQVCGSAVQRAIPVCVEAQGGEVEDMYCPVESRPSDRIRVCNPRPCRAKWWVGPWSECDCYLKDGIKRRMVLCAHLKAVRSYYITIVEEEECIGEDKPFYEKPCDKDKEKLFWVKKGERKKRDYMDLVPYSNKTENYSIWDSFDDDDLTPVNVREQFQTIDPENVEDYKYLKKIGIRPEFWPKTEDKETNRLKRRQAIITQKANKPTAPNERTPKKRENDDGRKKDNALNHQVQLEHIQKTKVKVEPPKDNKKKVSELVKKEKPELPKKSSPNRENEKFVKTGSTNPSKGKNSSSTKSIDKYKFDKPSRTTNAPAKNNGKVTNAHFKEKFGSTKEPLKSKNDLLKNLKPPKQTVNKVSAKELQKIENKGAKGSSIKTSEKKLANSESITISSSNTGVATSVEEITKKSVSASYTTGLHGITSGHIDGFEELHSVKGGKDVTQPHKNKKVTSKVKTGKVKNKCGDNKEFTMASLQPATGTSEKKFELTDFTPTQLTTVKKPEVKVAPGLTPHTMLETEIPAKIKDCWRAEMLHPRATTICIPPENAVLQPADEPPEWDFVNTSDVKIYVVPIQTTVRTIIQNDNEYVLMETLAKYPVADEMKVAVHSGDIARMKLKLASEYKSTTKSVVKD